MNFVFTYPPVKGLVVVEPALFEDSRGSFMETFRAEEYRQAGIDVSFVQENESLSHCGVVRGLHFQRTRQQAKLVRAVSGALLDVAVDLRSGSPTYGQWHSELLTAENRRQMFIPEGFAHGFLSLADSTRLCYRCNRYYAPSDEGGIRWDDPLIGVDWRLTEFGLRADELIVSDKDLRLPFLADSRTVL